MGQSSSTPRHPVKGTELKVGDCYKFATSGNGPYNYCKKVTKETLKRVRNSTIPMKRCKCPPTRKIKRQ